MGGNKKKKNDLELNSRNFTASWLDFVNQLKQVCDPNKSVNLQKEQSQAKAQEN
jgi:hypothetical protein